MHLSPPRPVRRYRFPIRYTLDRQPCVPPSPAALSECLDYSGTGVYECQVPSGALQECAPVTRVTTTGQR